MDADDKPADGRFSRGTHPRAELGDFLKSRRARVRPEDVGLPNVGRHRRVPGLRREELAHLAGVSVAYYTRLEQGSGHNVSAEVLGAIARELRLSDAERAHLEHLAQPRKKTVVRTQQVRGPLQSLLNTMDAIPAILVGRRSDVLAWNPLAAAVFGDWAGRPTDERNWARLMFLHTAYRDLFVDWELKAEDVVAQLRMYAGAHPDDPRLSGLVGELSVRSPEFRQLWATHDVREKCHGIQRLRHPLVGELDLRLETFRLADDPDQTLTTYFAEPGSPSAQALGLLASWGSTAVTGGLGTVPLDHRTPDPLHP